MNIEEIPYLRKVEFSYTMKTTTVSTSSSVTNTIGGELFVPTYMDPEWNVMCYLLTFPLKNEDPEYVKELMALTLHNFGVDENVPLDPWLSLAKEEMLVEEMPMEEVIEIEEEIDEEVDDLDFEIKGDLD